MLESIEKLRSWADQLSEREDEFGVVVRSLVADLREAADTIEGLRKQVAKCQIAELKAGYDTSRYFELFGTPEKAAEYFAMQCFGSDGSMCYYCPFGDCDKRLRNMGTYPSVYDKLLEWLRGDAS